MKVHMLFGGLDFEGSRVLAVYADETVAKEICTKLEAHEEQRPRYDSTGEAYAAWEKACPFPEYGRYDYYHVRSMEVL